METPLMQTFAGLQDRWKCTKHHFCYREGSNGKERHYEFEPHLWHNWAQQVNLGHAVMNYPPRTPEFDNLLNTLRDGNRTGKSSQRTISSDAELPKAFTLNVNHAPPPPDYYPQPSRSRRYSDPSPRKQKRHNIETLREMGYSSADWTGRGLDDYFAWLATTLGPSEKWNQALTTLREQDFGLDLFVDGSLEAQFLVNNCQMASGTAIRVVANFKKWCNERLLA